MNPYLIVAFYKFVSLPDYETMKPLLLSVMQEYGIKGTIILASEGINGTFAGKIDDVKTMIAKIHSFPGLENVVFKETFNDKNPFEKSKVKLRKEIVTLGVENINPEQMTGVHVDPAEWNALISDPDVVVIDTRNNYEVELGTFKGAINPETENFRDFPAYVAKNLLDKKDKKIAMCCTGGVRCEKSTAYLIQLGFNDVYQLNGGILNYLEKMPQENSLWEGTCFVFDERVTLKSDLHSVEEGTIDKEWKHNWRKGAASNITA